MTQTTKFLIDQLRAQAVTQGGHRKEELIQWKAADEIERLRQALSEINLCDCDKLPMGKSYENIITIARKALGLAV